VVIEELLEGRRANGRHALDEDALHTPIFAALSRGGWRRRQQEGAAAVPSASSVPSVSSVSSVSSASSVEDFRRDPLTAPLPIQAAEVTGGVIVDMAAGEARRRGSAVRRTRSAREWTAARDGAGSRRDGVGRERSRTPRHVLAVGHEWPGLDALADTGRHHLRPVANW
jgi:hypothetical protein